MRDQTDFSRRYRQLEAKMRRLAEDEGDVFLPNPEPGGEVDYIFVCMEPSLGGWAQSSDDAKAKVKRGFRNFLTSMDDFVLHFSIRNYLCRPEQRYHMTDFSKGAMTVKRASIDRKGRYDRWYDLLMEEIALVGKREAVILSVGKAAAKDLRRRGFPRPIVEILHYSPLAAPARARAVLGREEAFQRFLGSVTPEAFIKTARDVLADSGIPDEFQNATLKRLVRGPLSESRQQLMFSYMLAFESVRRGRDSGAP